MTIHVAKDLHRKLKLKAMHSDIGLEQFADIVLRNAIKPTVKTPRPFASDVHS